MIINFRQGLARSEQDMTGRPSYLTLQTAGVVIRTTNVPTIFTVAHGKKDYTITLSNDVVVFPRSEFTGVTDTWFYVDVDRTTGAQKFGRTEVSPSFGTSQPINPVEDQHWFDLRTMTMKVFNNALNRWTEVIRVFVGRYTPAGVIPVEFGSQVGVAGQRVKSGAIAYDGLGKALRDSDGFVTTEDVVFIDGAATHALKLESNVTTANAAMNVAAYHVVRYTNDGRVEPADYDDATNTVIGISVNSAIRGEPVGVVLSGKVYNPHWDWGRANVTLWISSHGQLTNADPYELGASPVKRPPVARSIDSKTIIFDQGLGGTGERGADGVGSGASVELATIATHGIVRLSHPADDVNDPVAVGINDPILYAPRDPAAHQHHASEVTVTTFGAFTGTQAQEAFDYISQELAAALLDSSHAITLAQSFAASILGLQADVLAQSSRLDSMDVAIDTVELDIVDIKNDLADIESGALNAVNRNGDTMVGPLKLTGTAVDQLDAVSLGEVQSLLLGATGSLAVTTRRLTLDAAYSTLIDAFNALSDEDRTIPKNQVLVMEYGSDVYIWGGATGAVVVATDVGEFILTGKVNFTIPDPTISVSVRNLIAANL